MKAVIYCRVSTEEQGVNGTSLDSQKEACLKKASELGYEVPEALVIKESFSGLTLQRPLLSMLRDKAKAGEFDAIIVFSPDRLSRVGEDILTLVKEFKLSGIKFICVNNQWDDSLTGKVIAFMLGWASELEAAQIKERTMRGKRTLAGRGLLPQGTGLGLYGYTWDKENKKRVPDVYESKIVAKIFEMISQGETRFGVAKTLNDMGIGTKGGCKWHPLTIERITKNKAYIGDTYFGRTHRENKRTTELPQDKWLSLPDATPAIISKELFDEANKMLKQTKDLRHGRPQNDYLLTGHIVCGYCGSPLIGSCLSHIYRYYHCRGSYPTSTRAAFCKAKYLKASDVENIVWERVKEIIENPQVVEAELKSRIKDQRNDGINAEKQINIIRKRLDNYDKQRQRLIDLVRLDKVASDAVIEGLKQIDREKQIDESELLKLLNSKTPRIDPEKADAQLKEYINTVKHNLQLLSNNDKRGILDALGVSVIATDDKLEVKISVPLEVTSIEMKTQYTFINGRKNRKGQLVPLMPAPAETHEVSVH